MAVNARKIIKNCKIKYKKSKQNTKIFLSSIQYQKITSLLNYATVSDGVTLIKYFDITDVFRDLLERGIDPI